jgi:hypothetical protein
MITAGHGPSPSGMLRAAGQIPSAVSISTEDWVTMIPFVELADQSCPEPYGIALAQLDEKGGCG